jgi:hypothetical protein
MGMLAQQVPGFDSPEVAGIMQAMEAISNSNQPEPVKQALTLALGQQLMTRLSPEYQQMQKDVEARRENMTNRASNFEENMAGSIAQLPESYRNHYANWAKIRENEMMDQASALDPSMMEFAQNQGQLYNSRLQAADLATQALMSQQGMAGGLLGGGNLEELLGP